jgi:hypothetical protein
VTTPLSQREIHQHAIANGFWKASDNLGEKIALIHSEVSEALEIYRDPTRTLQERWFDEKGKPEGFDIELADAVIRILDLGEYVGVDVYAAMREKHTFNLTRPYMHGKKV